MRINWWLLGEDNDEHKLRLTDYGVEDDDNRWWVDEDYGNDDGY